MKKSNNSKNYNYDDRKELLERLLYCPVCHEKYNKINRSPKTFVSPKIVATWYNDRDPHCKHKLCLRCYKNWFITCITEGNDLTCPTCRYKMMSQQRMVWYYNITRAAAIAKIKSG